MDKKATSYTKKENKGLIIKIITAILVIFSILCIIVIFKNKNYGLISGVIGVILLILTMNIANKFKVNKYNDKAVSIISIIACLVSIIFIFKQIIYSYVLVVPAFILLLKCRKTNNKDKLNLVALIISSIFLLTCFIMSIGGYIQVLIGTRI